MISIDPNKIYNTVEILEITKQMDWIKSRRTLNRWIEIRQDILKPITKGEGPGKRYFIKGSNLIDFIAQFEDGSLHAGAKINNDPENPQ